MSHLHSSLSLVLPWSMVLRRDLLHITFLLPSPEWPQQELCEALSLYPMKGDIRGKCCQVVGMPSTAPYISTASALLNLACKALCLVPDFFSSLPHTTLTSVTASNLTGFSSISLMSQTPFCFSAFAHVVPYA